MGWGNGGGVEDWGWEREWRTGVKGEERGVGRCGRLSGGEGDELG